MKQQNKFTFDGHGINFKGIRLFTMSQALKNDNTLRIISGDELAIAMNESIGLNMLFDDNTESRLSNE